MTITNGRCMPRRIKIYSDIILFGIRVAFECDHRDVLNSVCAAYALWNKSRALNRYASSVYIVIKSGGADDFPSVDRLHVQGTDLDIVSDGISVTADGKTGRGCCRFPLDAANSEALLDAINTIVLFLVAHMGRIPLHASA